MEVELALLGRFQVRRGGVEVPPAAFGGRKVRALLRMLAVRRPDLVPHGVLAEALWPDRLPADPATNLGVLVNRARRAVGDPGVIVTGAGGYALGRCTVDVDAFVAALDRARSTAEPAETVEACTAALAVWGDPLPEDLYADWARPVRDRLHRARTELSLLAGRAAIACGDPRAAAAHAADVVAEHPLDESATLLLAEALGAAGDTAGALERIARLRAGLAQELGVDPSPEADRLQTALLRGQVRRVHRAGPPPPTAARSFGELRFVGRDAEWDVLDEAVSHRGLVLLGGAAGTGKSRLLAELARRSALPVLAARAVLPERDEAWGLARSLLAEALACDADAAAALPAHARDALAVVLPELGPPTAVLDPESRRALILAGGLRLVEAVVGDGALLVVDDVQWADASSIGLLGSALARLPRLAAVVAHRPEETPPRVLEALRGARPARELTLGPLPEQALASLLAPDLAAALRTSTDGTPFAVAEVVRELQARGLLRAEPDGTWAAQDPSAVARAVELGRAGRLAAVRRRAERRPPLAREVLALLALLAREAPAQVVADAAGVGPRAVLDELSGLAGAGLVRLGELGWATAHDLVAEAVGAGLDPTERGRLHSLLAAALTRAEADPAEIAAHHRAAGERGVAAREWLRAAERALAGHATTEAAALAEAGLELEPGPSVRAGLLGARAEARAARGDQEATADLRAALALTGPGPLRARRMSRLAMLTFGAQDVTRAAELAELALVEAAGDGPALATALETAAIVDMNTGEAERAGERAGAALEAYRALGDAAGVARILDGRAMATFLDGGIGAADALFERVARLFTDSGELLRVVTPRSTRGHGLVFAADPAAGLVETTAALRLARDLDTAEGQAYALRHRAEALAALGRGTEAEADAREAIALAMNHRGWTATARRALGIALVAQGELDAADEAFARSAQVAGDSLTLFASWAASRRALTALAAGRRTGVQAWVARALGLGPALGHFEARLAEVELAAARADPRTSTLAAAALERATAGGHLVSVPRLRELAC